MNKTRGLYLAHAATVLMLATGCAGPTGGFPNSAAARTLTIHWQRLTESGGDTCGRCENTERSIEEARRLLTASLRPLGLRVTVVKARLTPEQFKLDPSQSNRIWIAERSLEEILGAKPGVSRCSGCCGESDCRTTIVDGRVYETIPPELIVRAGLKVAANMIEPAPSRAESGERS
ncbi:MAG TPA: DUF2703 domain-containing protein [Phycisphaerae bacterium]|nr:DUF2703 domain-containing protein [Phycisphaerae bacterium]